MSDGNGNGINGTDRNRSKETQKFWDDFNRDQANQQRREMKQQDKEMDKHTPSLRGRQPKGGLD